MPWYSNPEWWLCVLAFLTLLFIAWQARATADTVKATKDTIEHMIGSERAWILISSITKGETVLKPGIPPHYWWRVKNVGKTPARLIATQAVCNLCSGYKLPNEPVYPPDDIQMHERILGPGDSLDFFTYWGDENGVVFRERVETLDTIWLVAYGYVRYQTVFGSETHESRFCDLYIHSSDKPIAADSAQQVIDFRPNLEAPASYTRHT